MLHALARSAQATTTAGRGEDTSGCYAFDFAVTRLRVAALGK
jgi:hypothetical protein